jgi:hypothetical protein
MLVILRDRPQQVQGLTVRQGVAQGVIVDLLALAYRGREFQDPTVVYAFRVGDRWQLLEPYEREKACLQGMRA